MNRYPSLIFLFCCFLHARADYHDVVIEPLDGERFAKAEYRLWIPDEISTLQGIIVKQHGCCSDPTKYAAHTEDIQWQALARKHNFALLAPLHYPRNKDCKSWSTATDGSGRAFLEALDLLAKKSGHPELNTLPWALWGHSGGALWVMNMLYLHPERTLAVFARSAGLRSVVSTYEHGRPPEYDSTPAAFQVPVIFCYGSKEKDKNHANHGSYLSIVDVFHPGRKLGALWCMAEHPDSGHENGNSRQLAIHFFREVFKLRLAKPSQAAHAGSSLKYLHPDHGITVNLESMDSNPTNQLHKNDTAAATGWLPSASTAKAWEQFCQYGTIDDTSPPPQPFNVRKEGDWLKWDSHADPESGISKFNIYKNGTKTDEIKGTFHKRWNPESFIQAWGHGDEPTTELPDFAIEVMDEAEYAVSSVNQAGIESEKTILHSTSSDLEK